jgi:hypothetical protein
LIQELAVFAEKEPDAVLVTVADLHEIWLCTNPLFNALAAEVNQFVGIALYSLPLS